MPIFVGQRGGPSVPVGRGRRQSFERTPDGRRYFAVLGPSIHFVRSMRNLIAAEKEARLAGAHQAATAFAIIRRSSQQAMDLSAIKVAEVAEKKAKDYLRAAIVRPVTNRPSHLRDAIVARAIIVRGGGTAGAAGAVGVGDITELDKVEYWRAQEFGSTHLVGRSIRGYFFDATPGGTHRPFPPRGDLSRQHPVFGPTGQRGPEMHVKNPIAGKAFLTQATMDALQHRFAMWRSLDAAAAAQVRMVRTGRGGRPMDDVRKRRLGGLPARVRGFPVPGSR